MWSPQKQLASNTYRNNSSRPNNCHGSPFTPVINSYKTNKNNSPCKFLVVNAHSIEKLLIKTWTEQETNFFFEDLAATVLKL